MNREKRHACILLVGMPEGKRPLTRPSHSWVDNVKIDVREIRWSDVEWIDLAQDRDWWRVHVISAQTFRFLKMLGSS
jgi:hypothetical protein